MSAGFGSLSSPADEAEAVTPDDDTVLLPTRALYVGVAGDLVVVMAKVGEVTIANAAVGYHPLRVTKVLAATTAESIVALR